MFDDIKNNILNFIFSRMTILMLIVMLLGGVLVYRCFQLQIVRGETYLNDFVMSTEKTRDIASARGNIYDRNGYMLAYNELAYSVKIEDVYESTSKNRRLNNTIYHLIKLIEKNGDKVITDFKIVLDEDGEFAFTSEGASHLRFLADVFDLKSVDKLSEEQKASSARDVMESLSRASGKKGFTFGIGDYQISGDSSTPFVPGKGYSNADWLKMVTIRYAMQQTSFRKYIGTIIATNVCEETVAVIMENSEDLPGVSIVEDTIRRYNDSKYFAHVLGYTGKISSDELTNLNESVVAAGGPPDTYSINDVVGKIGLEASMETTLQGIKGTEKVVTNATGRVMSILEREEPQSGENVYCTLDRDLQIAVYNIVEQKLAGLVSSKIRNIKEYEPEPGASSSRIEIPIYDVYFAMINNNIVDIKHFSDDDAGPTEQEVYQAYLNYKTIIYNTLLYEMSAGRTPYNALDSEYQVYQSNIVKMLRERGVIMANAVDETDETQIAWAKDEVISLGEYLEYCIAKNWINVTMLSMDEKYSESAEIFEKLQTYIIDMVDRNTEFQKRFYKYMLLNDRISGQQICQLLCEQDCVDLSESERSDLYAGRITAYKFMKDRIDNLDITPAQLALDPCNASVVITDVNSGDVLCMVSYPGYDNNKMANSIDAEYYAKLNADKSQSQLNFATQYKAAPGSTFKIVSATAGLMEGVITMQDAITCTGTYEAVAPPPKCWKVTGHGSENITTAIKDSCNFFFYDVGYKLATRSGVYNDTEGLNTLYKYADMFGLSDKSGVEINEYSPEVSNEDSVRSAIGQGTNSYTTAELARYATTIANSGTCYDLTLIERVTDSEDKVVFEQKPKIRNVIDMPERYWNAFHLGMRQVVENKSYFADLAVNVAGKTGTAEQTQSRPSHALFICYAPYETPEIAIATRIPFGYSSDYAAQTTRDIIKYYYGLAEEDELINGTADSPDGGVSNEL